MGQARQIQVGSGLILLGMGALVLSGELFRLNIEVSAAWIRSVSTSFS